MNPEKLAARRAAREAKKEVARIESEKNQRHVKKITITINWVRSKTWGTNPNAFAEVYYYKPLPNGYSIYEQAGPYRASGCGYDKESTVIADIFNAFLKYKLWAIPQDKRNDLPYGIHFYGDGLRPSYGDGIGTNCYYKISECIGGKFEHVAGGKTFDVYQYTDNEGE